MTSVKPHTVDRGSKYPYIVFESVDGLRYELYHNSLPNGRLYSCMMDQKVVEIVFDIGARTIELIFRGSESEVARNSTIIAELGDNRFVQSGAVYMKDSLYFGVLTWSPITSKFTDTIYLISFGATTTVEIIEDSPYETAITSKISCLRVKTAEEHLSMLVAIIDGYLVYTYFERFYLIKKDETTALSPCYSLLITVDSVDSHLGLKFSD